MFKRTFLLLVASILCILYTLADVYAQSAAEDCIAASKSYQANGDYRSALKELQKIDNILSLGDSEKKALLDEYVSLSGAAINNASRKMALAVTDSATKAFPENERLIIRHGKAQLAMGKYKEAVNAVGRFLLLEGGESNDSESFALGCTNQGYGLDSVEPGKIANAFDLKVKNYQRAISVDPKWFLPYLLLGSVYISEKDYSKSQEYYEKGLSINPNGLSHKDYILLSSVYNENKLYPKTIDLLKGVPAEHPYWPGTHLYLGYAEENMGNLLGAFFHYHYEVFISGPKGFFFQPAQQAISHIIEEMGSDEAIQTKYPALANCIKAGMAGANRDLQQSIAYYSKAEAINSPSSPILYLLLGEAYMQNKDYDKAITYLQKVVALDPSFPPAYCEIGDMYAENGDMDNAILWWERGFATDPENWKVQYTKDRLKKSNFPEQKFSEFLKRNNLI